MAVNPIPDTSPRVIPMLVCPDVEREIEFCQRVLGADVVVRRPGPDGQTVHAALALGEARVILQAEFPQLSSRVPQSDGTSPVVVFVYVEDVDAAVEEAASLGSRVLLAAQDQFWGDRSARVMDPSGHVWNLASRIEDTTEGQRRGRWDDIRKNAARGDE
jgi:PhnB protein